MTEKKKIILTGATGFIGGAVARELLKKDYDFVVFSRNPEEAAQKIPGALEYIAWQPQEIGPWAVAIDGAYAVIHCAAPSIFERRYTKQYAQEALTNRIISTRGLVNAMAQAKSRSGVFISSASQGIYGFNIVSDMPVDETTPIGTDYWAQDSKPWEDEALKADSLGIRTVIIRTGYVLGENGGGLPYQVRQARKGQSGISQPGNAYCSWIHILDEARLYVFALENERVRGPMNCTAPNPVTNQEYANLLGNAVGRPVRLMPYFMVRLFVGKVAEIYARQKRVIPKKALELGFSFEYNTLDKALADLVPRISAS
ncbi:MAG: TIGR01777 family oxidoreductase [Anaerolineaceae bacterium]|jgi:uncharacterized protein (TIGR01777 family)